MFARWSTLISTREPKHTVQGSELDVCLPEGLGNRFAVYSVRRMVRDASCRSGYYLDTFYRVRDAEGLSDADARAGKRCAIVFTADSLDDVEAWLRPFVEARNAMLARWAAEDAADEAA